LRLLVLGFLVGAATLLVANGDATAEPCSGGANAIVCENMKAGSPASEWDISGDGDPTIQGYATEISVDHGSSISFKIKTPATAYRIDIYRLGWYGGDGARKVASITPSAQLPQSQPACLTSASNGLVDCGNWSVSASWTVPADSASGLYIARPVRLDTGGASHIPFVVRDDGGTSDLLVQTSDTSWQAYNRYGGRSLYVGDYGSRGFPEGRAYAVSYNRPFNVRANEPRSWIFGAEYPMIRFLERNGYDVSYFSGVDTDRRPGLLSRHKTFIASGHDEYWSGAQRDNVEAARDAGMNLAFFSGNEVFWKTRWGASIDGSNTSHRTLITYKETAAGEKLDPTSTWTGTWRDPAFSPPSDGGRPENSLTGTSFSVNTFRSDPMTVTASDGKHRFWRNTSVATLAAGQEATLPSGTLGYEWDSAPDNASRPAGAMFLSSTTHDVETLLMNAGTSFGVGPATHHLVLYRRPSGALVFGAGTVQWAFGLDSTHPGEPDEPDPRMQQATVNLFADMGSQPATLQPGLVAATASSDTTKPSSTITSPAPQTIFDRGQTVTISGTATDAGGGVVGVVEVSTDGGTTWHRANGRSTWSYSWKVSGTGDVTLKSRAVDDSGNFETPGAGVPVRRGGCPCSLWDDSAVPVNPADSDSSPLEVGVKFSSDVPGYVTGLRFYKGSGNTGTHAGHLWTTSGKLLGSATFTAETASGWQQVSFASPVAINSGGTYVASYRAPNGHFAADRPAFTPDGFDNAPLHAARPGGVTGANGVYGTKDTFPTSNFGSANYWVDVVFATQANDPNAPTIDNVTPTPDANRVLASSARITAAFSEALDPATATPSAFVLRDAAGVQVPATVTYDPSTLTAKLQPTSGLANGTTYTATVTSAVRDLAGNALASPYSWTFKTSTPGVCPCTIWDDNATPATPAVTDTDALELGVRFRSDQAGFITGVRFYKGLGNSGTHQARLWTSTGTLLATALYESESSTGWQETGFGVPIPIAANTTYVASYSAPVGHFAVDRPYFTAGLVDSPPLHALGVPNGVYSSVGNFPSASYNGSNYWVDVVFDPDGVDRIAPKVTTLTPADTATGMSTTVDVTAKFSEHMDPASITSSTVQLRDPAGTSVPATVSYDAAADTARLRPNSALALGTTYTATVKGGTSGAKDAAGNKLAADRSWAFQTARPAVCPCSIFTGLTPQTIDGGDGGAYELGVKFRSDGDGFISGVRFYKAALNTGTHTGRLWVPSGLGGGGTQLAAATFTNETASGWQQVNFAAPVPVTANTTYVASYTDPSGHFSVTRPYFASGTRDSGTLHALADGLAGGNGLYGTPGTFPSGSYDSSNYWVDVVYNATDSTPPIVESTAPAAGETRVPLSPAVTARFSKAMDAATLSTSTFTLKDPGGATVPAGVTYSAATRSATLTPTSQLAASTVYTATVKAGAGGARDSLGNALAADKTWTFTTFGPSSCPCTIFTPSATPAIVDGGDSGGYELGMKFRSDVSGLVTGVRFYKAAGNTGTHVGRLWLPNGLGSGTQLASATFSGESASGWQQVSFASPVAVSANTTYVVSYTDPAGHFSVTRPFFATDAPVAYPLRAVPDSGSERNGLYGSPGSFPSGSYNSTNYWVDVTFSP
jgi:hypothetical protein